MFLARTLRPVSRSLTSVRAFSSSAPSQDVLKQRFSEVVPAQVAIIKDLRAKYNDVVIGTCTVDQAYGGMRSVKSLITETSLLDPEEGIRFRGLSIPELQQQLPAADREPLPEALLWLLVTGEVPTAEQVESVKANLASRSQVDDYTLELISKFPKDMHPMTQFSSAVLSLQRQSKFAKAYQEGVHKSTYWDYAYEDSMDLIAKIPQVAANIYRHTFHNDTFIAPDTSLDWGQNFSRMLGFNDPAFEELIRLYMVIHSDHEGGNVSAHTTHLVGSALSDPYLSFSAGMNGLAGPLHGLANQEVLRWLKGFQQQVGVGVCDTESIKKALWDTLNAGRVIPGYGHAVLRKTDPRYTCQREFAQRHLPNDEMFKLVSAIYEVAPGVLTEHGKTKNPWFVFSTLLPLVNVFDD